MAGLTTAELNAAVDFAATRMPYASIHSADPGGTGANEMTGGSYARVALSWGAASGGDAVTGQATVNIPSGAHPTHFGLWSASTAGTFRGGGALSADPGTYGAAGTYALTVTLDGSTS